MFVLSDSINGYIYNFLPYYGSHTRQLLQEVSQLSYTVNIVLHLCKSLVSVSPDSGYYIFTDRFYSGVSLSKALWEKKIHHTGTIMTNRKGNPSDLKKLKLKSHETKTYRCGNEMVLAWKDKRQVTMISNYCDNHCKDVRRKTAKREETFPKPAVVSEYTKYMGGVDRSDHYCASYAFLRKTVKWWRKLFFWLIETSIVNSYVQGVSQLLKQSGSF